MKITNLLRNPQRIPALIRLRANIVMLQWYKRRLDISAERTRLLTFLQAQSGVDAASLLKELHNSPFKQAYQRRKRDLNDVAQGTSSDFDIEALYLAVRCFRPKIVVETGVLYGASSSHILQALEENGTGRLISIDLPPRENEPPQSYFVPDELRDRWSLHIGDSRVLLPQILKSVGTIDFFHHDSLHTYDHMRWEYQTAARHFSPRAVLTSHDVLTLAWQKNPFRDFCARQAVELDVFRNLGIAVGKWG